MSDQEIPDLQVAFHQVIEETITTNLAVVAASMKARMEAEGQPFTGIHEDDILRCAMLGAIGAVTSLWFATAETGRNDMGFDATLAGMHAAVDAMWAQMIARVVAGAPAKPN